MKHTLKPGAVHIGTIRSAADATRLLAELMAGEYKAAGAAEHRSDLAKALERKAVLSVRANEVMHTTNTGYGAELVPTSVLMSDFLDMAPTYSPVVAAFQAGFHGRGLQKIEERPVIGEIGFHDLTGEWTTTAGAIGQGTKRIPTAKITLTQKTFQASVDVSDQDVRYSVIDLVAAIQAKLAKSAARTIEGLIINGDTTNASTGNVNSDDADPADTSYYLAAAGLRKSFLAAATDVGTLAFEDFVTVMAKLGAYAANPADVSLIMNTQTFLKSLGISEFAEQYKNGQASTVASGVNALSKILGVNVLTAETFGLTEADGKQSATPGSNTKGGFMFVNNKAVQYGFGSDYVLEVYRIPGKGWQILGSYDMGLAIATSLVGEGATGALAINATV
jgi:HK97 family phage major capsid protein